MTLTQRTRPMFDYSADPAVRAVIARAQKERAAYVAGIFGRLFHIRPTKRAARA